MAEIKKNTPLAAQKINQPSTDGKVILKGKGVQGDKGLPDNCRAFEIQHAQNILDITTAPKTWELSDPDYIMKDGKITKRAVIKTNSQS